MRNLAVHKEAEPYLRVLRETRSVPRKRLGLVPEDRAEAGRKRRIEAVDFARGVAVTLMILSHGIKGLLSFEQIPAWGLVPIHLLTKFSSSLFILVFGLSVAVVYGPYVGTPDWPAKRAKMLFRGLKVFFWYKVLTIAEMTPLYTRQEILDTLLYRAFPVYVEILGFYALALLWVPLALPAWKRIPLGVKLAVPVALAFAAHWLYHRFDFWDIEALKAILVEHDRHYTWGQLARAPLIFVGLLLGERVLRWRAEGKGRAYPVALNLGLALALFGGFLLIADPSLRTEFIGIARNEGKHPPELKFMLFSLGGAFLVLALSFLGGRGLSRALAPVTVIGKDALQAFVCHIFVLFVVYRYLLGYWHNVSYGQALALTGIMIVTTALWVKVVAWARKWQR